MMKIRVSPTDHRGTLLSSVLRVGWFGRRVVIKFLFKLPVLNWFVVLLLIMVFRFASGRFMSRTNLVRLLVQKFRRLV